MQFKENQTIYLQIAERISDEILLGHYAIGSRIPSVREYAALVEVNANTVMRPGESYRVPEGKGMILSAGKYNGVEVYVNGRLAPVIQPNKKMNIALDPFVEAAEH